MTGGLKRPKRIPFPMRETEKKAMQLANKPVLRWRPLPTLIVNRTRERFRLVIPVHSAWQSRSHLDASVPDPSKATRTGRAAAKVGKCVDPTRGIEKVAPAVPVERLSRTSRN